MSEMKFLRFLNSKISQSYLLLIDNFSFILGNILLYWLFSIFIDINYTQSIFDYSINIDVLSFIIITIISFIIVGKNVIYWKGFLYILIICILFLIELSPLIRIVGILILIVAPITIFFIYLSETERSRKFKLSIPIFQRRLRLFLMAIIVFPRILFFNISHFLFPLLFIWLSIFGILYLMGLLIVINVDVFLGILTIFGIMSGFFQYYVKGYKENIQKKLDEHVTKLILPQKRFTLDEYKEFLKDKKNKYNFIAEKIKQIERYTSSQLYRMPNINRVISQLQGTMKKDFELFEQLEEALEDKKDRLIKSYKGFFSENKAKIISNLDKRRVREIFWLLMGNINIIGEALVTIETTELPEKEPESYSEFFVQTNLEILNDVMSEFIFGKYSDSD